MYFSTKTYGHELGLSAVFRQHRATHSHCSKLHGYALAVKLTFGCHNLDDKNWVQDFGGLKLVKDWLMVTFDHRLVVAMDDPALPEFRRLHDLGLADIVVMEKVGCEAFAKEVYDFVSTWLFHNQPSNPLNSMQRVWLDSVEVMEHGANSAIFKKD